MENCLVTKLKATVNNDNLPVLNTWKFKINVPSNYGTDMYYNRLALNASGEFTVHASDGKNLYAYLSLAGHPAGENYGSTYTSAKSGNVYTCNLCFPESGEYYISIKSKYLVTKVISLSENAYIDSLEFESMPITNLTLDAITDTYNVNAKVLPTTLTSLELTGRTSFRDVGFRIDDFVKKFKSLSLQSLKLMLVGSDGTFDELGKIKSLTSIFIQATQFGGTIEGFVRNMVATPNAVTTGSVTLECIRNTEQRIRFNGKTVSIYSGSAETLSWQPSATIGKTTVTLGSTTIDIDNVV